MSSGLLSRWIGGVVDLKQKGVGEEGLCRRDIINKMRLLRRTMKERKESPEVFRALKKILSELVRLREEYSERSRIFKTLNIQRRRNIRNVLSLLDRCILNIEMDLLKLKINVSVVSNRIPGQYTQLIAYIEDLKSRLKRYNLIQLQRHIDLLNRFAEDLKGDPDPSSYNEAERRLRDVKERIRRVFAEADQIIFPDRNIVINTRESFE